LSQTQNTIDLTVGFIFGRAVSLLWNIVIARALAGDLSELGFYLYSVTQYSLFSILAEGSINYAITHFLATQNQQKERNISGFWKFALLSKAVLGVLFGFALFIVISSSYENKLSALLLGANLLIFALGSAPAGILSFQGEFRTQVVAQLVNTISFTCAAMVALGLHASIEWIYVAMLTGNTLSMIIMLRKGFTLYGNPLQPVESVRAKPIIYFCLPVLVASFSFSYFYRSDVNMVARFVSTESVPYVSIALTAFFLLVDLLWSQYAVAMTPDLLSDFTKSQKGRIHSIRKVSQLTAAFNGIAVCAISGAITLGQFMIEKILGNKGAYVNSIVPFSLLLTSLPFLVGYAFLHRLYLIRGSANRFMAASIAFVVAKLALYKISLNYTRYEYLTALSAILMACAHVALAENVAQSKLERSILRWSITKTILLFTMMLMIIIHFVTNPSSQKTVFAVGFLIIAYLLLFGKEMQNAFLDLRMPTRNRILHEME